MTEHNNESLPQEQRKTKPKIEDLIPVYIAGDMQKNAFEFVTYMRESKMSPGWSGVANSWKANYKGKTICNITLKWCDWVDNNKYCWFVIPYLHHLSQYEEAIINEGLQDLIWNNQQYCVHKDGSGRTGVGCNPNKACAGGENRTFYGKEIVGVCRCSAPARFYDPNEATINGIKRLLELEREAREGSMAINQNK